jgi:hypothetical protein
MKFVNKSVPATSSYKEWLLVGSGFAFAYITYFTVLLDDDRVVLCVTRVTGRSDVSTRPWLILKKRVKRCIEIWWCHLMSAMYWNFSKFLSDCLKNTRISIVSENVPSAELHVVIDTITLLYVTMHKSFVSNPLC